MAWSFVQGVAGDQAAGSSKSVTLGSNVTVGNRLIAIVYVYGSGITLTKVADNLGNQGVTSGQYDQVTTHTDPFNGKLYILTAPITTGGSCTITATATGSASFISMWVGEYSGLSTVTGNGAWDVTAGNQGTIGTSNSSGTTGPTNNSGELAIACLGDTETGAPSAFSMTSPGGWTVRSDTTIANSTSNLPLVVIDQQPANGSTVTATWTCGNTDSGNGFAAAVATFITPPVAAPPASIVPANPGRTWRKAFKGTPLVTEFPAIQPLPGQAPQQPIKRITPQPKPRFKKPNIFSPGNPFLHLDAAINQTTTSANSVSVTLGGPVNAGDLLCAIVGTPDSSLSGTQITDNAGNTWTVGITQNNNSIAWCLHSNASSSPLQVTVTTSNAGNLFLVVDRFTYHGNIVSQIGLGFNTAQSLSSGNAGTITGDPGGSLLYGGIHGTLSNGTFTAGSSNGLTAAIGKQIGNTGGSGYSEYIPGTAGPASQSLTWSASGAFGSGSEALSVLFAASSVTPVLGVIVQGARRKPGPVKPSHLLIAPIFNSGGFLPVTTISIQKPKVRRYTPRIVVPPTAVAIIQGTLPDIILALQKPKPKSKHPITTATATGTAYNSGGIVPIVTVVRHPMKQVLRKPYYQTPSYNSGGIVPSVTVSIQKRPKPTKPISKSIQAPAYNSGGVTPLVLVVRHKPRPKRKPIVLFSSPYNSGGILPALTSAIQKKRPTRGQSRIYKALTGAAIVQGTAPVITVSRQKTRSRIKKFSGIVVPPTFVPPGTAPIVITVPYKKKILRMAPRIVVAPQLPKGAHVVILNTSTTTVPAVMPGLYRATGALAKAIKVQFRPFTIGLIKRIDRSR